MHVTRSNVAVMPCSNDAATLAMQFHHVAVTPRFPVLEAKLTMESQTRSCKWAKRAFRELQNWRVQGNPPIFCQPFATFANLFCQPLSKPLFLWTPGSRSDNAGKRFSLECHSRCSLWRRVSGSALRTPRFVGHRFHVPHCNSTALRQPRSPMISPWLSGHQSSWHPAFCSI